VKKVFIDCGFYRGEGTSLFKKTKDFTEDFILYGFEATPPEELNINPEGITLNRKAVWTHDGILDFHISGRARGRCNGVFKNDRAKKEKVLQVPCIDFGKWIMDNFDEDDFIVLKMDIEGAEFELLQSMIDDGSIKFINIAYIEFHHKRDPYGDIKAYLLKLDTFELRKNIESCYTRY